MYCARPGPIRPRSLLSVALTNADGARPADHDLAEVAHVEDADRGAHRGVLLDDAGVLQRHVPAAELGELRAEGRVPVVQRRAGERGRRGGLGSVGHDGDSTDARTAVYPPPHDVVRAAHRQPCQDPGRSGGRRRRARRSRRAGTARLAPGGEDVAKAYGRKLAPLLATLGLNGKPGEVAKVPTSGTIASPLLVLVGLGADPDRADGTARRGCRRPGGHQLGVGRAGAAGRHPGAGPRRCSRATGSAATRSPATRAAARRRRRPRSSYSRSAARRKEAIAAFDEAQLMADAVVAARDWVNTPPGRPDAGALRRRDRGRREAGRRRQGQGATTRPGSPSSAAAASSASAPGRTLRRGWSSSTTAPKDADHCTWRWSARASPSTPAA